MHTLPLPSPCELWHGMVDISSSALVHGLHPRCYGMSNTLPTCLTHTDVQRTYIAALHSQPAAPCLPMHSACIRGIAMWYTRPPQGHTPSFCYFNCTLTSRFSMHVFLQYLLKRCADTPCFSSKDTSGNAMHLSWITTEHNTPQSTSAGLLRNRPWRDNM
jgi:hypothetical protein